MNSNVENNSRTFKKEIIGFLFVVSYFAVAGFANASGRNNTPLVLSGVSRPLEHTEAPTNKSRRIEIEGDGYEDADDGYKKKRAEMDMMGQEKRADPYGHVMKNEHKQRRAEEARKAS